MIKQFINLINIDIIICLVGLILFCIWLIRTRLCTNALSDSIPRGNNMPVYLPFIPLLIWIGAVPLAVVIARQLTSDLLDWQTVFLDNLILCIGAILVTIIIIFLARVNFVRRLRGFGLNINTIHKDFFQAVVNLLAVWPIVIAAIIVTTHLGKLFFGQDFEIQPHQELQLIIAHPQLPLRVLIIVTAVAVVPVFEEMLFRGLFQTMIRSYIEARRSSLVTRGTGCEEQATNRNKAWLSIVISSWLFATFHANIGHWPALFVLAICLGYAYEKSGSLFRPIFIHSLFNGTVIIAVLYSS